MRNLFVALAIAQTFGCSQGASSDQATADEASAEASVPKKKKGKGGASASASSPASAARAATAAAAATPTATAAATAPPAETTAPIAAPPAAGADAVTAFYQGEPTSDIKAWKGWVNNMYDYGFRIPPGWTTSSLPGSGYLMHDADQKAMIMLNYVPAGDLTLANLQQQAKNAPFNGTDLVEVVPPTFVDVGSRKFLAKAGLAKGMLNKTPGEIYWMDLAGIQTHEGERSTYHFIVMAGLKEGVSEASRTEAMSAIRAMTPMSGTPYWKR